MGAVLLWGKEEHVCFSCCLLEPCIYVKCRRCKSRFSERVAWQPFPPRSNTALQRIQNALSATWKFKGNEFPQDLWRHIACRTPGPRDVRNVVNDHDPKAITQQTKSANLRFLNPDRPTPKSPRVVPKPCRPGTWRGKP